MFHLHKGDYVRIERSPYVNGHFYLRFKDNETTKEMTLGFGYDEPYVVSDAILSHPVISQARMIATAFIPVSNKWMIYKNDNKEM